MNHTREIVAAALRWHTARERRLEAGRQKRNVEKWECGRSLPIHCETSRQVTELKRQELATLLALAKACEKQRGYLGQADDAVIVQLIEMA